MGSMDKAGIVIAIAIVAAAVGFTMTGGTGSPEDIPATIEKSTEPIKDVTKQTTEKIKELSESGTQVMKDVSEKTQDIVKETKDIGKTAKELATSKLPSRLVSIPAGTSVPGCDRG